MQHPRRLVFCAPSSLHEAIHIHTVPQERALFGLLVAEAVDQCIGYICFPAEGQLLSGAAFHVEFTTTSSDEVVRVNCTAASMLDPIAEAWREL